MYKLKELFKNTIPVLITLSALLFAGSVSFTLAPKSTKSVEAAKDRAVEVKKEEISFSPFSKHSPQPKQVLGVTTKVVSSSPAPTATPKASVKEIAASPTTSRNDEANTQTIIVRNVTEVVNTPAPTPTATPTPAPTSEPSPTPAPVTVSVEINSPAGKSNFRVEITEGMNACEILEKAKEEGKIATLVLDDKYLESFGTLLVAEMNGYSSNWIFTVNGESPMGCSLSFPKPDDQIIWTYLTF